MGLTLIIAYHSWLLYTIHFFPLRTVIRFNAQSRRQLVPCMISDPIKNGVFSVQTLRNNIMASTLLATTAITLSSLMSVFVTSTSNTAYKLSQLVYGNKSPLLSSIKYFCFASLLHSSAVFSSSDTMPMLVFSLLYLLLKEDENALTMLRET